MGVPPIHEVAAGRPHRIIVFKILKKIKMKKLIYNSRPM